jgi:hypothetical protein
VHECGVESDQLVRGWRAYLMDEDDLRDEDDLEDRVFMFCPVR